MLKLSLLITSEPKDEMYLGSSSNAVGGSPLLLVCKTFSESLIDADAVVVVDDIDLQLQSEQAEDQAC